MRVGCGSDERLFTRTGTQMIEASSCAHRRFINGNHGVHHESVPTSDDVLPARAQDAAVPAGPAPGRAGRACCDGPGRRAADRRSTGSHAPVGSDRAARLRWRRRLRPTLTRRRGSGRPDRAAPSGCLGGAGAHLPAVSRLHRSPPRLRAPIDDDHGGWIGGTARRPATAPGSGMAAPPSRAGTPGGCRPGRVGNCRDPHAEPDGTQSSRSATSSACCGSPTGCSPSGNPLRAAARLYFDEPGTVRTSV